MNTHWYVLLQFSCGHIKDSSFRMCVPLPKCPTKSLSFAGLWFLTVWTKKNCVCWHSVFCWTRVFRQINCTEKAKILYFLNLVYFLSLVGLWQNHVLYWTLTGFMWRHTTPFGKWMVNKYRSVCYYYRSFFHGTLHMWARIDEEHN